MSSDEAASASYSDAQSISSHGGDITKSSDEISEPPPRQKPASRLWLIRSETFYLALLFAFVALVLPTLFSLGPSSSNPPDTAETRKSPLAAIIPYIPTISSVVHVSYSTIQVLLRPFHAMLSLILALLGPLFLTFTIIFNAFVLLPSRMVAELAQLLYPVYLFCGVACLFGAGIGVGGRLLIEGGKLVLASPHDSTIARKSK